MLSAVGVTSPVKMAKAEQHTCVRQKVLGARDNLGAASSKQRGKTPGNEVDCKTAEEERARERESERTRSRQTDRERREKETTKETTKGERTRERRSKSLPKPPASTAFLTRLLSRHPSEASSPSFVVPGLLCRRLRGRRGVSGFWEGLDQCLVLIPPLAAVECLDEIGLVRVIVLEQLAYIARLQGPVRRVAVLAVRRRQLHLQRRPRQTRNGLRTTFTEECMALICVSAKPTLFQMTRHTRSMQKIGRIKN